VVIAPAAASVTQILTAQLLLPVATAPATDVVAAVVVTFAAAIAAAIALAFTVTIAAACIDVSTSARSASPDDLACGDNSPSRQDALELW
jgi:hypothetical protein